MPEGVRLLSDWRLLSVGSGVLASLGSFVGKLVGLVPYNQDFPALYYVAVVALLLLMVNVNTLGFVLYSKALFFSSSSLEPTLLNSACGYISSAALGMIVFGEATSLLWWTGTFLILSGVILISWPDKQHDKKV